MEVDKVSASEVVRHAFEVGVNPSAIIQLLGMRETLPDIFTMAWEVLVDDHNFPNAQWLEPTNASVQRAAMWIADTGKIPQVPGLLIFGKSLRSLMNSAAGGFIGTGGLAFRSGLHRRELLCVLRGQVPMPHIYDLLPQLAAGLEFTIEELNQVLDKAMQSGAEQEHSDEAK